MAVAWSSHPDAATATGEVAGALIEALDPIEPDLLWVTVTPGHLGAFPDIVAGLRTILRPGVTIGCTTKGVLGAATTRPSGSAPGLAAGAFSVAHGDVTSLRVRTAAALPDAAGTGLRFAFGDEAPSGTSGGPDSVFASASGPRSRGGLLALDDAVHAGGTVAVDLGPATEPRLTIAPAYVPLSPELTVTGASGTVLRSLGGRPPAEIVAEALALEEPVGAGLLERLLLGTVGDGAGPEPVLADLRPVPLLAADPVAGSFTVGVELEIGRSARLLLRDPSATAPAVLAATADARRATIVAAPADVIGLGADDPVSAVADRPGSANSTGALHAAVTIIRDGIPTRLSDSIVCFGFAATPEPRSAAGAA